MMLTKPSSATSGVTNTSNPNNAIEEEASPTARSTAVAARAPSLGYLPPSTILLNTEHVLPGGGAWISAEYVQLMRAFRVWDLSAVSARRLARWYGVHARAVPLGLAGDALRTGT